jgi:dipeptidyl-peptidase-4
MRLPRPAHLLSALPLTLLLSSALPLAAGDAADDENTLTFDVIFGDGADGRVPSDLSWSPDGRALAYLWDDGQGKALWRLDVDDGERRALVREGGDGGLELAAFHWSPSGETVLLESGGDIYLVAPGGETPRRLTDTAAEETDPKFSPDGSRVAFVRDFDLWTLDLASGEQTALTGDGVENEILNGVTDWVYWEEIWGRDSTGYWWSPEGDRIAYYRFDETPVGSYPLVDFTAVPYPTVEWQKYPKAGTANPLVKVGVMPAGGGETIWLDTRHEPDDYLARVDWLPSGEQVAVQRLNREQDTLELLSCNAVDGSCGLLHRETWPTWVNLHQDLRFLADGRFLWSSEKSGWRRLYLHDAAGTELAALTPEGWALASLDGVDEEAGTFVYTAYRGEGLGAKNRLLFRGRLDGGPPEVISSAEGWHSATVAEATGYRVHSWSDADHPTRRLVLDADGKPVAELPGEPPPYDPEALPAWRFFEIDDGDGGKLPAAMLQPAGAGGDRKAPAIMYHYGGPASQVVANRWSSRGRGLWHKMMAQRGFAVLMVDNPGSNYFGKRGEDRLHRRFGEVNLAAQLAGVAYLEGLGTIDPERIALWGWSGGGANTLYSILRSPGTWAAGMSGAPVTDWRLYDTIWTERYLDHPKDNPDGYRESSARTHAGKLATPLLIVHGTGDDNVHPQNTLAMVDELIEAGAPVEMAIYPRQKHGFRGISSRQFYERMTEFFERKLAASAGS